MQEARHKFSVDDQAINALCILVNDFLLIKVALFFVFLNCGDFFPLAKRVFLISKLVIISQNTQYLRETIIGRRLSKKNNERSN